MDKQKLYWLKTGQLQIMLIAKDLEEAVAVARKHLQNDKLIFIVFIDGIDLDQSRVIYLNGPVILQ